MEIILIIVVFLIGFLILAYLINKQKDSTDMLEVVKMLKNASVEDRKLLLETLSRNTQSLNLRLDSASQIISQVQKNLGEMSEIGRGIRDFQEFLKSPKIRGNLGEQILKELLSQILPKGSFHLQYAYASGERVDAAIKTSAGIIPIDSKFPMDNFKKISKASEEERKHFEKLFEKDVKMHIDSISKKYISADEGTIDYALMYIPSEAVYYEVVNSHNLFEYAGSKRVLPVSPTTFYAYMKAILMSFEGQKIEESAKEILSALRSIQKDYKKTEENLSLLRKHLLNASNSMQSVFVSFSKLGSKIKSAKTLEGKKD